MLEFNAYQQNFQRNLFSNLLLPNPFNFFDSQKNFTQNFSKNFSNSVENSFTNKQKNLVGTLTLEERKLRIEKYKEKKKKWRSLHPISRGFTGRKLVARTKPRIRGKFVKESDFKKYSLWKLRKNRGDNLQV